MTATSQRENNSGSDHHGHDINSAIMTITKEVRGDDMLVKQLTLTGLSAYTQNPINLAINAPSGEGKSYAIIKVFSFFPDSDVYTLAGMSEKALFHRPGKLVVRNTETGEYDDLEPQLRELELELLNLESTTIGDKMQQMIDAEVNQKRIADIKLEMKHLRDGAIKLIDLQHKILLFLDTPKPELLTAIMPLLSHDKHQVEYQYVDTNHGIKTKTNILRGFPAVVFAQALDLSRHPRYSEISRRFIITNPRMSEDKYRESTILTAQKYGLPDLVYQKLVVSDHDKRQARDVVNFVKLAMLEVARADKPGRNSVFVPYADAIQSALPSARAQDMTTENRFFTYNTLLPITNLTMRPKIRVIEREVVNVESQTTMLGASSKGATIIPIATFDDLAETMRLMEYANSGLRPYQADWYSTIFLPTFQAKTEPDTRNRDNKQLEETIIAVTTKQLIEATKAKIGKNYSSKQMLDTYIYPLLNNGIIDQADSQIDKRAHIYYPIASASSSIKLFDFSSSNESPNRPKLFVKESTKFPSKSYIISKFQQAIKYYEEEGKRVDLLDEKDKEISLAELVDKFYDSAGDFFATASDRHDADGQSEGGSSEYMKPKEPLEVLYNPSLNPVTNAANIRKAYDKLSSKEEPNKIIQDSETMVEIVLQEAKRIQGWLHAIPSFYLSDVLRYKYRIDQTTWSVFVNQALQTGKLKEAEGKFNTYALPKSDEYWHPKLTEIQKNAAWWHGDVTDYD